MREGRSKAVFLPFELKLEGGYKSEERYET